MCAKAVSISAPDHVAYADETHHNVGRYRGIGLVTASLANASRISQELETLIRAHRLVELKWGEMRSAKSRFAAHHVLDYLLAQVTQRALRVDILTWDVEDSRHKIPGRNDIANLRRMYFFLFRNVLCRRWPARCRWSVYVDENTQQPWSHLRYLDEISLWEDQQVIAQLNIHTIGEVKSHKEPLIQVADLLAGLAVYSRAAYAKLAAWRHRAGAEPKDLTLSNADRVRLEVLGRFHDHCKKHKLGVSLRRGLRTYDPERPMNFWWYQPQGSYDKAPT